MMPMRILLFALMIPLTLAPATLARDTNPHIQEAPSAEPAPAEHPVPPPEPAPDEQPVSTPEPAPELQPAPSDELTAEEPTPAGEEAAIEGQELATEAEAPQPAAARNPCEIRGRPSNRLDHFREELFETVCEAAAEFDGFFGNRRFDEEARRTYGRAGLRLLWDEHDGVELDGNLKVNVDFPNLDHRVNAFLGREDRESFLSGDEGNLDFLPTFFEREGREEWLVGFGYRPVSSSRNSLDFDVGIDVDSSIDPFARTRYRHFWLVGDDNLLRARQTVYYTNEKGLGSGTRLDFERPVGQRSLVRWSGNITFDDETEGGDWDAGITLYHGFSPDRAIAWFIGVDGETKREVPLEDYGTSVTYRQRMLREWFFGELVTGVTWPRDTLAEQREMAFHVGFGFEIQFSAKDLGVGRRR